MKIKRKFTIPPASIRRFASKSENDQIDRMIKQIELKHTANKNNESKEKAIRIVLDAKQANMKLDLPSTRPSKSYSQAKCPSIP